MGRGERGAVQSVNGGFYREFQVLAASAEKTEKEWPVLGFPAKQDKSPFPFNAMGRYNFKKKKKPTQALFSLRI